MRRWICLVLVHRGEDDGAAGKAVSVPALLGLPVSEHSSGNGSDFVGERQCRRMLVAIRPFHLQSCTGIITLMDCDFKE